MLSTAPADNAAPVANPFAEPSPLPFDYPQFDRIRDSDFAPAFDAGMAEQMVEVRRIADSPAAPTFENTLVALEKSGQPLRRARNVFDNLVSADTNDARNKLRQDYAPRFAAHEDAIDLDTRLFARLQTLYSARAGLGLDAESRYLLERYYEDFVHAGAKLSAADKEKLKAYNAELAALTSRFSQNMLDEVNDSAVVVNEVRQLDGLTPAQIAAAAAEAKMRGLDGKYVLTLLNTTGQPEQSQLTYRPLRQRLYAASVARGSRGGKYDNTALVSRIVKLRAERAALLGCASHAACKLEDQMARTPGAVNAMLRQLAPPAVANAKREAAELQQVIDREDGGFQLAAWDWDFYSERVRARKYAFDEAQLKPYLELWNVEENGVFHAANLLYGLTFSRRTDLPVYQPDVRVYDVFDAGGKPLAIFIADMYARKSKNGGAWMSEYVSQSKLLGRHPVVANHLNIPRPPPGEPTLLTWDEVVTAFHEFGHALHGMLSDVTYPYFAGTSVPRDFVEYPSQFNEMWADWPAVLQHYARHYQTGAPMPRELLDKVVAAAKFNQGFATTEYLAAAMLDQDWHQLRPEQVPAPADVMAFEKKSLAADGVDFAPVPPRYHTPYFRHILAEADGYDAGYYAYIWAEVLDANTREWFRQHGGATRANGQHFRDTLLSRGGSVEAMQLFRDFAGHEPRIEPLLEKRGLAAAAAP
ncbi:MAG TPA: M3 family metallopeptidase [Steroidobacteraceae bacterium]|nr:M3 family metallopeptidase [Steroidobacteraceae bacterium]